MNVSKIGVTQVLPKSSPLYKSFRIAEIRKKILKDGSIAVAKYKKGDNLASIFEIYEKGTNIESPDAYKGLLCHKVYSTLDGDGLTVKTCTKEIYNPDEGIDVIYGLPWVEHTSKTERFYNEDNQLLRTTKSITKGEDYSKTIEKATELGKKDNSLPATWFLLEDKNGIFSFAEFPNKDRIYKRIPPDFSEVRTFDTKKGYSVEKGVSKYNIDLWK